MAALALLVGITLAARLANLGSATPTYDEFYHMLAARGWLLDGTYSIGSGEYHRAALFTRIVAEFLRWFGDSLLVGRLPAMIAGTLWVVAVFAWTRHVAGSVAAWTAGLLLALDPGAIHLSQWVRFYTLHGLLIWVGAICAYHLLTEPFRRGRSALIATTCVLAFSLAMALQTTTLVAIAAVGAWAGAVLLLRLPRWYPGATRRARLLALAAGLALLAGGAIFLLSGKAAEYWELYQFVNYWSEPDPSGDRWYVWWLAERYSTLWVLFPVAIVIAIARFTRVALFALTIFAISFVTVSLGSPKAERYLYFALPFFFVLWGLALASLLPALRSAAERAVAAVSGSRLPQRARAVAGVGFTALAVAFIASQNDAPRLAVRMITSENVERPYRLADWNRVLPQLRPWVDSADVVVASYILKPLYYFGRGDFALSWTETAEAAFENGEPVEFAVDDRTGRPTISSAGSLARLMECFASGLVVVEQFHLNRAILVPEETSAFLLENTTELELPPESWVRAFRWTTESPSTRTDCPSAGSPSTSPLPRTSAVHGATVK